jgi:hypothetical protein
MLLEKGGDVNAGSQPSGWLPPLLRRFEGGHSPLWLARRKGDSAINDDKRIARMEEVLLNAGAQEFAMWEAAQYRRSDSTCMAGF